MPSPEYTHLRERCEQLKARFINFTIPIDRAPESQELDQIAAFKLLMHAELEHFLEDRARSALSKSVARWRAEGVITKSIFNIMVAFYPADYCANMEVARVKSHCDEAIRRCEKKALELIKSNDSIKRAAFGRLLSICGLLLDDLDEVLISDLDKYGSARGEVAHTRVDRVRTLDSPEIEAQTAKRIVGGLLDFDGQVEAVLSFGAVAPEVAT